MLPFTQSSSRLLPSPAVVRVEADVGRRDLHYHRRVEPAVGDDVLNRPAEPRESLPVATVPALSAVGAGGYVLVHDLGTATE